MSDFEHLSGIATNVGGSVSTSGYQWAPLWPTLLDTVQRRRQQLQRGRPRLLYQVPQGLRAAALPAVLRCVGDNAAVMLSPFVADLTHELVVRSVPQATVVDVLQAVQTKTLLRQQAQVKHLRAEGRRHIQQPVTAKVGMRALALVQPRGQVQCLAATLTCTHCSPCAASCLAGVCAGIHECGSG